MAALAEILTAQPFWFWAGLAVALLAVEAATGSGWLLWPAASAGVVALVALVLDPGWAGQAALFAGLTLVTTFGARRFFPRGGAAAPGDINGRIALDGKEWAAELEGVGALAAEAEVEVTGIRGAILQVRRRH